MPRTSSSLTLVAMLFVAGGCSDPAKDKPAASIAEPAKPAVTTPPAAPSGELPKGAVPFTEAQGSIAFVGSKISGKEQGGSFARFKGHFVVDGAAVKSARVEIDMSSVTTAKDRLTEHLRSDDFFDVPNHPTATFTTSSITARAAAGATHIVKGDLTLRGATKSIEFPATLGQQDGTHTLQAEFSFDRQPFGVAYNGKVDDLIRDDVVMTLQLSAAASS